jgi:hypothetical protein
MAAQAKASVRPPVDGQMEPTRLAARGAPKSLPDDPPWATPLAWATRRGHDKIASRPS